MHTNELRIVATRFIDRFKNMTYQTEIRTVHFIDGIAVGHNEPWEASYIINPKLPYLGADLPDNVCKNLATKLEKSKQFICDDIDKRIAACNKPPMIFPDDFKDYKNFLQDSQ